MLLGIDPGMTRTGWCVGDGTALPTAGACCFTPTGDDLGALMIQFDDELADLIETHCPLAIAYEAPILVASRDRVLTLRKTYALGAHIEWVCKVRGIECVEVDLKDVKRELAGLPSAEKHEMVRAAEKLGVALPLTKAAGREDAADAVGAWLLLLRSSSRTLSERFDKALWGSRANRLALF